jgi:sigma-B regulation protein RsbQ
VSPLTRNHVTLAGNPAGRPIMFAHGFGCDQNMWRLVTPAFAAEYRLVLYDHVGAGRSEPAAWDAVRYSDLRAYAEDTVEILREADLRDVVFVGHSVAAMIGVLAYGMAPDRFDGLVLVGPSPRYINDGAYVGGFERADIEGLLDSLDSNYLGWSSTMAPVIMGNADRPELGAELTNSFCRTDPAIARQFARVTFLSDNRADLAKVSVPTLILQCQDDVIAPEVVGEYVQSQIADSELLYMEATGHCPNLSAPTETSAAIEAFLQKRGW